MLFFSGSLMWMVHQTFQDFWCFVGYRWSFRYKWKNIWIRCFLQKSCRLFSNRSSFSSCYHLFICLFCTSVRVEVISLNSFYTICSECPLWINFPPSGHPIDISIIPLPLRTMSSLFNKVTLASTHLGHVAMILGCHFQLKNKKHHFDDLGRVPSYPVQSPGASTSCRRVGATIMPLSQAEETWSFDFQKIFWQKGSWV